MIVLVSYLCASRKKKSSQILCAFYLYVRVFINIVDSQTTGLKESIGLLHLTVICKQTLQHDEGGPLKVA